MADFAYVQDFVFDSAGDRINNSIFGGSITDEDNDDQFEAGDQVFATNDYAGTMNVDGIEMPVFLRPDGAHHVYNPGPGFVSPPLTVPAITPGPYSFCFAAETQILTAAGETPVASLRIGDLVMTASGSAVAVKWIGRQTLKTRFPWKAANLVRISAGALGDGLPHSDLTVTADHGMVVDGLVINASAMVNGSSIDYVALAEIPETCTVYHVETEAHDVILANGAPSETFIDYRDRRAFDNFSEYLDLYGAERIIPEMPHPRISAQRTLPDFIRRKLGLAVVAQTPDHQSAPHITRLGA